LSRGFCSCFNIDPGVISTAQAWHFKVGPAKELLLRSALYRTNPLKAAQQILNE
jgi:hypothetical protein